MGYTHYWWHAEGLDPFQLTHTLVDCAMVIEEVQRRGIILAGPNGEGEPELGEGVVRFNGDAGTDMDYGHFRFPLVGADADRVKQMHGALWAVCKTNHRPYDLAVTACLLLAKLHLGDQVRLSSNGEAKDWAPAEALLRQVFGYTVTYKEEDTLVGVGPF